MTADLRVELQESPVAGHREGSLGRRLVIATLGFCLVFTLIAVGVRTWWAWESNLEAMQSELSLIDQVFQSALSKAIWEMDRDALETQLNSVSQAGPVGRVELQIFRAGRPPEVLSRGDGALGQSSRVPSVRREMIYEPYAGAAEAVGQFTLEGNESLLLDRLLGEVESIIGTQVIQSLLLAGLIMWMFNRSVTLHVRRIARHLTELSPANLGEPLRLERKTPHRDELSLLESGVNGLQEKLSDYLERQRQDEQALAAHRDRLADLVAERTAELRAANSRLEELSRSDPLTGLANRRQFDELKEVEFRRALRQGQPLSVLMCDIDFFKPYNDTYGHAEGDRCLQAVAEILKLVFARAGELVARVGGEEFAVLLPGSDAAMAIRSAERLREQLAERALPHGASPASSSVTMSIGVAEFDPSMNCFGELLRSADEALYRAKALGRNQISG